MLTTPRLHIRELLTTDLENMHALNSIPEVDEYNTLGLPDSITTTQALLENCITRNAAVPRTSYILCIEHVQTGAFMGLAGLNVKDAKYRSAELWYKFDPQYWGKGYATEMAKCLIHFAFTQLKLHRVEAGCATANIASVRVLEKAGMTREGHTRKKLPIRGQWVDNYEYAILEEDINY